MSFVEYQPHQIVFLECEEKRLYAEVIQTVIDRQLCWARPLVILSRGFSDAEHPLWDNWQTSEIALEMLVDLRQESDLLLPLSWFQMAVDTEVIPVLAKLSGLKPEPYSASDEAIVQHHYPSAQEQLQQFIRALCLANQNHANPDREETNKQ
ncbi:hypothetical protein [Leptolyngbya sp. FACHB-711]|uniref:hypothetical protein n=1 Tax=unclassified Leptolyngbya TaxID=2650499 RepID=UPI001683AD5B|nr:hypothetical protein [Leptolyngbya sp. FACHB-711]MBD1853523.1 hypothetical protein [Cyanobacteria bacterium FACHB-502]MBD2027262.1 hypothetical protein [Leptolyngbya sp. FACHB-711]